MNDIAASTATRTTKITSEHVKPKVGDWYWVGDVDDEECDDEGSDKTHSQWFGCVTHVGTNYVNFEHPKGREERIHASEIRARCVLETNPDEHIAKMTTEYKHELDRLTCEIRSLTSTLGLSPVSLAEGDVSALATRTNENAVSEYKTALVLAKEKTLPDLFSAVKETSENLKMWLSATTIPLKAQVDAFKDLIEIVNTRIFNVELYAGLVETIVLIADGKEAPLGEKVRLMQRRAYMDEECLAEYQTGGMDFDSIEKFDEWMAAPDNYCRILPFPRCVIAFRVRRHEKERECESIRDFIRVLQGKEADEATFLYMRNGEKIYRLQTAIDFGAKLFPDIESSFLNSEVLYAETFAGSVNAVISGDRYAGMVEREQAEQREYDEKTKGMDPQEAYMAHGWGISKRSDRYIRFSPDHVMYDDIEAFVKSKVDEHNRLVVVLQGLMDRSPVFHPHPRYSLWKEEDFLSAFELIYDDSRTFTSGSAPDFEAFRAELNASLREGCVTVGQEVAWEIHEAVKECNRLDNDWRARPSGYRPKRLRPHGDPGPGRIATVVRYSKKSQKCTYKWQRDRRTYVPFKDGPVPCSIVVDQSELLNVSAYQPGSFKQFFADPRTRADYLKWAPLLLAAEEYHAGNKTGKPERN